MKANLDARYDLYINGQWVPASDGKVFTAYNPATGEKLAECAEATKEDVDAAVKAADVQLLDVRVALGLGGKGYALMTGDVAAVNAAVEAGSTAAAESGLLVSKVVIPSPAETVFEQIA